MRGSALGNAVGLTVIGEKLAKPGLVFRYDGETDPGCAACKLYKACHGSGLKKGREYRVSEVRAVKHDVCHVFEGKVQLVAVEPAPLPVRIAIPVSATRGTGVSKRWEECGAVCMLKRYCNPSALVEGRTAQLVKVEGEVPCLVGRKLRFASVQP
jgi:uncharacterized protein (UPF0179 family)